MADAYINLSCQCQITLLSVMIYHQECSSNPQKQHEHCFYLANQKL